MAEKRLGRIALISLHWWVIALKCKVGAINAHCDSIKIRLSLLKRTFQPSKIHCFFKIDKARFVHCIRRWQSARNLSYLLVKGLSWRLGSFKEGLRFSLFSIKVLVPRNTYSRPPIRKICLVELEGKAYH